MRTEDRFRNKVIWILKRFQTVKIQQQQICGISENGLAYRMGVFGCHNCKDLKDLIVFSDISVIVKFSFPPSDTLPVPVMDFLNAVQIIRVVPPLRGPLSNPCSLQKKIIKKKKIDK